MDGKKGGAKRTYTSKPPPGQTCSFQLRLCLDPGNCWYLPPWAGNAWHNHEKHGATEKRRRMVTLSQQHQYEAGVYSRHGTSGQTSGILNELHGNSFSSSQINYNKKKQNVALGFVPPFYPSACHGLCIYHLILQPLQRLTTDKGEPIVKAMFHT